MSPRNQGISIGPYDIQNAAIAQSLDMVLLTINIRELERIKGLTLENWVIAS